GPLGPHPFDVPRPQGQSNRPVHHADAPAGARAGARGRGGHNGGMNAGRHPSEGRYMSGEQGTGAGDGTENGYVLVGREPDGESGGEREPQAPGEAQDDDQNALTSMVEQPAKVMRIGTMIKQLLEEVRSAPLDDASRTRMREIYATSIRELEQGLSGELRDELERLTLPFTDESVPSDA